MMNRYALMYGGRAGAIKNDVSQLDPKSGQWKPITFTGNLPEYGRFGHSAVIYKKHQLIVFGGEKCYNQQRKIRDCLNDTRVYDSQNKNWSQLRTSHAAQVIQQRRSHAAAMCGRHMIVYGGINMKGIFLNDVWELNMKNRQWTNLFVGNPTSPGLANLTMSSVFSISRRPQHIQIYRALPKLAKQEIIYEGIYTFGGQFKDGTATNQVKYLNINHEHLQWLVVKTKGVPPKPRFSHSMDYFDPIKSLVVFGGKNNYPTDGIPFYSDIGVLNLQTMTWVGVCTYGIRIEPRCNHMSFLYGSRLICFGGINKHGFVSGNISILEMDQKKIQTMLIQSQERDDETQEGKVGFRENDLISQNLKDQMKKQPRQIVDNSLRPKTLNGINHVDFVSYLPMPADYDAIDVLAEQKKL